ncbi:ABC transporter substrate-binding protein [Kineothrix sp. MB12-C1]|uniref:ABC transporter substrate-binding protein n=1 Tax=Kineothrix sp. MB12-C1 TaxID=3070215 RepID=UPI0027D316FC|nr:extracellular solute-binding protein [Kineothrix sp. MB12-C1]WMC93248.1 extracellular solute-binding protein [Kineothrix sp. MB12-C1]
MKKKLIAMFLATVVTASSVLTGCGQQTESKTATQQDASEGTTKTTSSTASTGERTKITALLKGTESTEQYQVFNYLLSNYCEENGLEYEIELVNDMQDYFTKLQMYINSNTLPDIYGCPNGTLSKACKDIDALVDVGAELKRNGYYDKMNGAIVDFLTDADDGNIYLFPQGLYCEYFMYRTDIFEEAGITEAPATWGEFEAACQKIADIGEIPLVVGGSDAWQLMRYLSFSPWRITGPDFITNYQAGSDKFSSNDSAKYAVNLLHDLGTKGYFEPGFASVDYTSACNLFFGGTGAIFYSGSGQIGLANEMYKEGKLGFFPVPDTEGMENMPTNVPIHAGFAEAFNKATYDDTMQNFFDYMCENFSDACYTQAQIFSPFNEDLPEGLSQLYYDTQPMFSAAETAWTSWDDKLDSEVLTKIVDEQQKLAQGIITPDEFISNCDTFVTK